MGNGSPIQISPILGCTTAVLIAQVQRRSYRSDMCVGRTLTLKLASLPNHAAHFDAAVLFERKAKTGAPLPPVSSPTIRPLVNQLQAKLNLSGRGGGGGD